MFASTMSRTGSDSHLTVEEHRELLASAGYCDLQVFEEYEKGWLCATGWKRSQARNHDGGLSDPVERTAAR